MPIKSFGSFNFEQAHIRAQSFSSNFGQKVNRTIRLPSIDGGFRLMGLDRSPSEVGNVQASWILRADDAQTMQGYRDALNGMQYQGLADLVLSMPGNLPDRFCKAEVKSMRISERFDAHTDYQQSVNINFQVPYPRWLVDVFWSNPLSLPFSGFETTYNIVNSGNARARCIVTLEAATQVFVVEASIQREVNSTVVEAVSYDELFEDGDQLVVNGLDGTVKINGVNAFGDVDYTHPRLISLAPGNNTINVLTDAGSGTATFQYYFEFYGS